MVPFRGSWGVFPWYPAPGVQPQGYYHQSTTLSGNRLGILVDPGAWTNLAGSNVARKMAHLAAQAGLSPTQAKMNVPLHIQGVGSGCQSCTWQVKVPIAVPDSTGEASNLHYFEAPTVDGTGADLPALLGLRSMRAKGAVLEMTPGKECLTFPGPGGYKVEWSPGTMHFPLEQAPSGHLIMPTGEFDKLSRQTGGLPQRATTFHATPSATPTGQMGTGSDAPRTARLASPKRRVAPPRAGPGDRGATSTFNGDDHTYEELEAIMDTGGLMPHPLARTPSPEPAPGGARSDR